jgi:hypothetical protein
MVCNFGFTVYLRQSTSSIVLEAAPLSFERQDRPVHFSDFEPAESKGRGNEGDNALQDGISLHFYPRTVTLSSKRFPWCLI